MSTDQPILGPKGDVLFSHNELSCNRTQRVRLATGFADKLRDLRLAWGREMGVNSCCRSRDYNTDVGGAPDSYHIYDDPSHGLDGCAAIDIRVMSGVEGRALAVLALGMGWSVGVPKRGFLHLDRRDLAGQAPVVFGY